MTALTSQTVTRRQFAVIVCSVCYKQNATFCFALEIIWIESAYFWKGGHVDTMSMTRQDKTCPQLIVLIADDASRQKLDES